MTKRKPDSPDVLSENIIHELYREPTEAEDAAIKAAQKADKAARDEICEALSYDPQIAYLNFDGLIALRAKDKARIAELEMALSACVTSMERLDFSEGVCCCGDPVETHGMGSGHSPVDMGDYYASKALEAARAALVTAPEKRDV